MKNYDGSFTVAAQSRNATEFSRIQLQQLSIRDVKRGAFDRFSLSGSNTIHLTDKKLTIDVTEYSLNLFGV
jgi:hypothetical protein